MDKNFSQHGISDWTNLLLFNGKGIQIKCKMFAVPMLFKVFMKDFGPIIKALNIPCWITNSGKDTLYVFFLQDGFNFSKFNKLISTQDSFDPVIEHVYIEPINTNSYGIQNTCFHYLLGDLGFHKVMDPAIKNMPALYRACQ